MFLLNKVISIDADSKIQISTYVWSASVKALDVVQSNLRIFKKTKFEQTKRKEKHRISTNPLFKRNNSKVVKEEKLLFQNLIWNQDPPLHFEASLTWGRKVVRNGQNIVNIGFVLPLT